MDSHPGASTPQHPLASTETANDRFKRSFENRLWVSILAAIIVHAAVLGLFPTMYAADLAVAPEEIAMIDLPEKIEFPPPPEPIQRPARPVISASALDPDLTIPETTFETLPPTRTPPPPVTRVDSTSDRGAFTPYEVAPVLANRPEVARALEREYPPLLRSAGIGGEIILDFHISEAGEVLETVLAGSSGHAALDAAAQRVAEAMRFSPARNLDKNVAVWVRLRVTFEPGGTPTADFDTEVPGR